MDVDWNAYPHLDEAQRNALVRMSQFLGSGAASEVLRLAPQHQVERLGAFVHMEQMYTATAQRAFEEAETQLRERAEEQLQIETKRLVDEQRREIDRLQEERRRLEQEAEIRVHAAESQAAIAMAASTQHSRTQNTDRRKAIKLDVPKYSGKDNENLEHWFLSVETAATAQ